MPKIKAKVIKTKKNLASIIRELGLGDNKLKEGK